MTYPEIVQAARKAATVTKTPMIVYHNLDYSHHLEKEYDFCSRIAFEEKHLTIPIIRMLLIMPNGKIVQ